MRTLVSREFGAVRPGTLIAVAMLAIAVGIGVYLGARGKAKVPIAEGGPVPIELARTNLVLEQGRLHEPGKSTPFTGIMVEHYFEGTLRSCSVISNGLLHGLSEGWFTNGQLQVSEHFKEGVSHGLRTKWYADGVKQSEADIAEGKLNGTFKRWHTNGVLSELAQFVADRPDGTSVAWFPSGYLKARVVMENGKPTEQVVWKDGEKKE